MREHGHIFLEIIPPESLSTFVVSVWLAVCAQMSAPWKYFHLEGEDVCEHITARREKVNNQSRLK